MSQVSMKSAISARALARSGRQRGSISSFSSAMNDSAAVSAKHEPVRLMLCHSPNRHISQRSSSQAYSLPPS
ncbi:hypothetical protein ABZZ79_36550 [Streptomyces sp. NPDC006458]|uniref:hypothetical protein n=1 Tax=Streptomyces sp. NPDC006458 TaxID=3154302 RepID=UPI0033B40125